MDPLLKRFLDYVRIDTQSDDDSDTTPSTQKQFDLARVLYKELEALGVDFLELDDQCYLYAHLHANLPQNHPAAQKPVKMGLIAHLDTSPDTTGANVNPQIIENYNGGDIAVTENLILTENQNPDLKKSIGHTLVTTDGTTLLGADDKAGIAIIMDVLTHLKQNPEILHPEIRIAFTPDEEIGKGALHFNLEKFDADFAYTVDGGPLGEINKETFSADSATIDIVGKNIHPGEAKDVMVNAVRIAGEIITRLPKDMAPETTEKRQPFIHPYFISGDVAQARIKLLLRAFDDAFLVAEKQILETIIADVKSNFQKSGIVMDITQTYRNMKNRLDEVPHVTDHLEAAVRQAGIEPQWIPVRGGTDGSGLTAMGLPCPNIFTGGHNYHGPMEWVSLDMMRLSVRTILNLLQIWVNEA